MSELVVDGRCLVAFLVDKGEAIAMSLRGVDWSFCKLG